MTTSGNKERTSITIRPDVFTKAKDYCVSNGEKISFSELVTRALDSYLTEKKEVVTLVTGVSTNGETSTYTTESISAMH
jgi:hypothetical protein